MELEDVRETLVPRVAELEGLLQSAQTLADQKIGETAHLTGVLADAQARAAQLELAAQAASQEVGAMHATLADVSARLRDQTEAVTRLETALARAEAELRVVKSSRSWRWTAWLRSLAGKSPDENA
ncbi:MAG: hypothetical protein ACHQ5A_00050 [Opitutales bacterium]